MADAETCSICGRTILAGEAPRTYVTRDGDPRIVCDLCRPRAEAAGWIIEGRQPEPQPAAGDRPRGRGRMRRMLDRARESAAIAASRPVPREDRDERPAKAPAERPDNGDGGPPVPTRRHSVPQSAEQRIRRAFQRFNASDERRMVAGLIRSLGEPSVSAVTSAASPADVRITVAWELAWYQWEIDIARADLPLRELARGDEVDELGDDDRNWNARANADGELSIGVGEVGAAGG